MVWVFGSEVGSRRRRVHRQNLDNGYGNMDMAKNPAPPRSAPPSSVPVAARRSPSGGCPRSRCRGPIAPGSPRPARSSGSSIRRCPSAGRDPRRGIRGLRKRLRDALLKLELREQDVARLEQRNAYLEGELKLQGQHHTNALKEIVTLKQQLVQQAEKRRHRPPKKWFSERMGYRPTMR